MTEKRTSLSTFKLSALAAGVLLGGNTLATPIQVNPITGGCSLADAIRSVEDQASRGNCLYASTDEITLPAESFNPGAIRINLPGRTLTISGQGPENTTLNGGSLRTFFVQSGTVTVEGMRITNAQARGGNAGRGGGGGAGLGGAMLAIGGDITARNVVFENNSAVGGDGGDGQNGGGGGMRMNGADGVYDSSSYQSSGGNGGGFDADFTAADGSMFNGGAGAALGSANGANGGFGGGGGGGGSGNGGNGGFGGGGGAAGYDNSGVYGSAGNGGFGGGGAAGGGFSAPESRGAPGFGGGAASAVAGGGGAGLGGAIFMQHGTLTLEDVQFINNSARGGEAGRRNSGEDGEGIGGAIFICSASLSEECSASLTRATNVTYTGNTATTRADNIFPVPKKSSGGSSSSSGSIGWWALLALPLLNRRRRNGN